MKGKNQARQHIVCGIKVNFYSDRRSLLCTTDYKDFCTEMVRLKINKIESERQSVIGIPASKAQYRQSERR